MSQIDRIADQIERSFRGPAWHGDSLMELLAGVDAATAAAHRLKHTHSIWEIVLHLDAWQRAVRRRLAGEVVELKGEQDWPPVAKFTDSEWQTALRALEQSQLALLEAVRALPEDRLGERVPNRDHDIYFTLLGLVQHTAYHTGQIALLKKNA